MAISPSELIRPDACGRGLCCEGVMRVAERRESHASRSVARATFSSLVALLAALALGLTALADAAATKSDDATRAEAQWICKGDLPPAGYAFTAAGPGQGCAGHCNGRYAEPLREQMVICQDQPVPDGFEVVGEATSPRCECIGRFQNALVIRRRIPEPQY
jgi:hypothetical protein